MLNGKIICGKGPAGKYIMSMYVRKDKFVPTTESSSSFSDQDTKLLLTVLGSVFLGEATNKAFGNT